MPSNDDRRFPSPRLTRIALIIGVPLALAAGPQAVALALTLPKTFAQSDPVSAAEINANFKTLADGVTALEAKKTVTVTLNGMQYSVGATAYVGGTQGYMGADIQGYTGAKRKCEAAFPSRPGVHMCTTEELARTAQVGIVVPNASWYAAATRVGRDANSGVTNDCFGWTDSSAGNYSAVAVTVGFSVGTCNQLLPIACCD